MIIFCFACMSRVVEHSERPFAYGIDWLAQRLLGKLILFRTPVLYNESFSPRSKWWR